jgi:cysteine-rich repeat protein
MAAHLSAFDPIRAGMRTLTAMRHWSQARPLAYAFVAAIAACACAGGADGGERRGAAGRGEKAPLDVDNASPVAGLPAPAGCGNGIRTPNEACDDANREGGDGCTGNCLGIEPGFACQPEGVPCRPIARCGDRVVGPGERCDDGNTQAGDGCSERCKLEEGFACDAPGEPCTTTTCGDGEREGAEGCDDGDTLPFDGCSSHCQAEPACDGGGGCSSACGDGLVIDEACDDGNTRDGDGCSATCVVEPGFSCERAQTCVEIDGKCVLRVPVLYRDFDQSHPDFQIGCGQLVTGVG